MKALPNILTSVRILMGLAVFLCLAGAAGAVPVLSGMLTGDDQFALLRWALILYVVAASTDFFDGWLARRMHAESAWGAILDPIADKILLAGTVLGLLSQGAQPYVTAIAVPSALIIFREFFVSALRETTAGKGVKLKVTQLAKWKTTVQLVALALVLLVAAWPSLGLELTPGEYDLAQTLAYGGMWLAAVLTVWTGVEYAMAADRQLRGRA
jgi:CDP-diacylglycerol--glycerol-3-phosphate 3-phosphatidyltransferase